MTQDQRKLRDWIEAQEWTFAKTVPDAPHEYAVCLDPARRRFLNWFARYAAKHRLRRATSWAAAIATCAWASCAATGRTAAGS